MGELLKRIRAEMGYGSARSFYSYLSERGSLEFNYSYYMKIEAGQVVPSHKIVHQIAALVSPGLADELICEYCRAMFPSHGHLFQSSQRAALPSAPREFVAAASSVAAPFRQLELTERQVACIARSSGHYFLFLLVTLARYPIEKKKIVARYGFKSIDRLIADLVDVKLLGLDAEGRLVPNYPEYKFPKAETDSLKKHFALMDEYDREKIEFFGLTKIRRGQFFRRISPRYVQLIQQNLELTFQMIRMSDESDPRHNTEAVSLAIALHSGPLLD